MKLSMLISPGIWDLLERLRPHLDVTLDLLDRSLAPLLPDRAETTPLAVRQLAAEARSADATNRFQVAVRTGQHQVFVASGVHVGLFPIRGDRSTIGLLVVAAPADAATANGAPRGGTHNGGFHEVDRRLERLGWSLRATIEADISTHAKLSDEEQRSRWLATILRFVEHLYACGSDRELFSAIVEGAAIWGDFDARVYARDLGGQFVLASALSSAPIGTASAFPGALLAAHPGIARISSIPELEQLGWPGNVGEVLTLPIGEGEPPPYLFAVGGTVDAHFERVFTVTCRTVASCLEHLATARARDLHARLMGRVSDCRLRFPAPASQLLADIASAAGAAHARILLREAPGEEPRVLAAVGGSPVTELPRHFPPRGAVRAPRRLLIALDANPSTSAWLDLGTAGGREFSPADASLAEAGAAVIEVWLAGALQGLVHAGHALSSTPGVQGFEVRIQEEIERARRFKLEAGLLVVHTPDMSRERHVLALSPVVDALRSQLRASDLVGRLSSGDVAALLVHTNGRGATAVASRVQQRLLQLGADLGGPAARIGTAAYPQAGDSAAALVTAAMEDLARAADA
jgi:GGDEF domain-containing protein